MENNKTLTVDELRQLYYSSPAKIFNQLNVNDKIYTDSNRINNLEGILRNCKINYKLKVNNIDNHRVYEITISEY